MGRSRFKRTAAILLACIAVHVALLSILAIEATRSGPSATIDPPVIQITLQRPQKPPPVQSRPPPAARKPSPVRNVAAAPSLPATVQPTLPSPPSAPVIDGGAAAAMGDLVRALRGSVGCSNPDAVGLSEPERQACRRRLHAQGENVKPLLGLTEEKQNRFERAVRCRREYYDAPIPPGTSQSDGPIPGLGHVPRLRDCPPSDQ